MGEEVEMKLGDWHFRAFHDGRFKLDGGAMFGVVPKVMWEKQHPADEHNRIDSRFNRQDDTLKELVDGMAKLDGKFDTLAKLVQSKVKLFNGVDKTKTG